MLLDRYPENKAPLPEVLAFTVFYSFARIEAFLPAAHPDAAGRSEVLRTHLRQGERDIEPLVHSAWNGKGWDIALEMMIDRATFPGDCVFLAEDGCDIWRHPFAGLMDLATIRAHFAISEAFKDLVRRLAPPLGRPRLLDLGGRARSGVELRQEYPECDVTVLDIHADQSVDVVGDAHALSSHFPADSFDFLTCVSVFEHLLMPWKVAVEINRVLKPGGYAMIYSHQTVGLHDMPWDFLRFSDASWQGLFNRYTGFEIVRTDMSAFMHIVPREWRPEREGAENSGGFERSSAIVRKIGPSEVAGSARSRSSDDVSAVLSTGLSCKKRTLLGAVNEIVIAITVRLLREPSECAATGRALPPRERIAADHLVSLLVPLGLNLSRQQR